jgi:GNAT superfamily N-acetyltransferase
MLKAICTVGHTNNELVAGCSLLLRRTAKRIFTEEFTRYVCQEGVVFAGIDERNDVVSCLITSIWQPLETHYWNRRLPPDKQIVSDPPALYLADLATAPEARREGIATKLIQTAVDNSKLLDDSSQFSRVIAISRVPPRQLNRSSYGLLLKLGFTEWGRLHNFYVVDGWRCPDCSTRQCRCSGHLMLWERGNDD